MLDLDRLQLKLALTDERQVFVDALDTRIDGLRLEVLNQEALVFEQASFCDLPIMRFIPLYCPDVGLYGIGGKIRFLKELLKVLIMRHFDALLSAALLRPYYRRACDNSSYYEKIGAEITCIDEEIPFEIPKSWEFIRLGNMWELLSGRDLEPKEYNSTKNGVPYITGASNFKNGTISIVRWTDKPQVVSQRGDLLITCKGTVGEMAVNEIGQSHIARQIMAIRNPYGLNIDFLRLCIVFYIEKIKSSAKGLIPGISRDDVLSLILPLPSIAYQAAIVERVSAIFSIIDEIAQGIS